MSITVTTPATETKLTTVAACRAHESIDDDANPATIERMIRAASRAIEKYCGRTFARQTYEERIDGNMSRELLLRNSPIIGIPTVLCDSSPVVDFEVGDAAAGILYRTAGWQSTGVSLWFAENTFLPDVNGTRYTVSYEAGYLLPGEKDSTLDADIEEACIETVAFWWVKDADPNVRSHKVDDLAITYSEGIGASHDAIPPHARSLLPRRLTT